MTFDFVDWFNSTFIDKKPQWKNVDDMSFGSRLLDLPAEILQQSSDKNKDPSNWSTNDNPLTDWLYGDWDETKYQQFLALHLVPVLSDYLDLMLDYRADQEYLNRYGLSYADIHDPRKLRTSGSFGRFVSSGMNFVSSNVKDLYR